MLCCWLVAYAFKCAHSSNGDPILCYINGHQQDRQPIPWREMSFILRLKKIMLLRYIPKFIVFKLLIMIGKRNIIDDLEWYVLINMTWLEYNIN